MLKKTPIMTDPATGRELFTKCEIRNPKKRNADGSFFKSNVADRKRWERTHGPIPDGHVLDHLCNDHRCRNQEHHDICTQAQNIERGIARGTREAVVRVKWSDAVTLRVFEMWHIEGASQAEIYRATGVASATISNWIRGRFKPHILKRWLAEGRPLRA